MLEQLQRVHPLFSIENTSRHGIRGGDDGWRVTSVKATQQLCEATHTPWQSHGHAPRAATKVEHVECVAHDGDGVRDILRRPCRHQQ